MVQYGRLVLLERNLYGHPLAGLLWERQFEKILLKHGWEKIPNWECDDYWNVEGSRELSDFWTGFTQFTLLGEKPPDGFLWCGERLTKRQVTSRPDHLRPELWTKSRRNAKLRERSINGKLKNQSSIMLEEDEESISLTLRTWSSRKSFRMQEENWKH